MNKHIKMDSKIFFSDILFKYRLLYVEKQNAYHLWRYFDYHFWNLNFDEHGSILRFDPRFFSVFPPPLSVH